MFGLKIIKDVFQFWLNKKSVIKLVCLKCVLIITNIKYDFFGFLLQTEKSLFICITLYYIYLHNTVLYLSA